jgi:hypothetical protein
MDRKHKRFYIGSHFGHEADGYICSSKWMLDAFKKRPNDFKRRILARNISREDLRSYEQRWLNLIKVNEIKNRYYNLNLKTMLSWSDIPETRMSVSAKISRTTRQRYLTHPQFKIEQSVRSKAIFEKNEHLKQRLGLAKVKTYLIQFPTGVTKIVTNLRRFASLNGLQYQAMCKISKFPNRHHRKYRILEHLHV